MTTALAAAFARALALKNKPVRSVVLPSEPVRPGVALRHRADAPLNVRPITVLKPVPADKARYASESLSLFPVPAQRLAR